MPGPTNQALDELAPDRVFIAGRHEPGSKRTQRRLRRYRTGAEGRISHLKRRYALDRSRLKGDEGQQIWTEWAILAYNADTLAVRTRSNTPRSLPDRSETHSPRTAAHTFARPFRLSRGLSAGSS
jgi:hypothetical protein